jgi:hypothetical protein
MSTLETQYKEYLSKNPESKLTFEDWRQDVLIPMTKSMMEHTEGLIELQKLTQKLLDKEESKK